MNKKKKIPIISMKRKETEVWLMHLTKKNVPNIKLNCNWGSKRRTSVTKKKYEKGKRKEEVCRPHMKKKKS